MSTPTRICSICLQSFPETSEFFHKNAKRPNGLMTICKTCRSEKRRKEYRDNEQLRNHLKEQGRKRYWTDPDLMRQRARDYASEHSAEAVERIRKWRENNHEKYHASLTYQARKEHFTSKRDYYRAICENRRAKREKAGGTYTENDIVNLFNEQGGKCAYCGKDISSEYHVDHVVPISRGGSNYPSNLALACSFCNLSKGARLLEEWKPILCVISKNPSPV